MTDRDPAVEAAERAFDAHDGPWWNNDSAEAAAREALAPLRPLIEDARTWTPYDTRDIGEAVLFDSVADLLDELSALIYPESELT